VGDKKDHLERDLIRVMREIELMLNPDDEDHEEFRKVISQFTVAIFGWDKNNRKKSEKLYRYGNASTHPVQIDSEEQMGGC